MVLFYLIDAIVHFSFMTELANPFIIAMIHSIFNLSAVIIMLPISEVLVKLAMKTIPVTPDELEDVPVEKSIQILDERFLHLRILHWSSVKQPQAIWQSMPGKPCCLEWVL